MLKLATNLTGTIDPTQHSVTSCHPTKLGLNLSCKYFPEFVYFN